MSYARILVLALSVVLLLGDDSSAVVLGTGSESGADPEVKPVTTKRKPCRGKGKRRQACLRSGRPGGVVEVTPPDAVEPAPEECQPPEESLPSCRAGDVYVDEAATWHFNTVLERGCGRFVIHHQSGNALLGRNSECTIPSAGSELSLARCPSVDQMHPDLEHVLDRDPDHGGTFDHIDAPDHSIKRPDLDRDPPPQPAWVLALRGCGLGEITGVAVDGGGVDAQVIDADQIAGWRVPLSSERRNDSVLGSRLDRGRLRRPIGEPATAFVRFEASAGAEPVDPRRITVFYEDGGSQVLDGIEIVVARNGVVEALTPTSVRWEDRPAFTMTGGHLGNARLLERACLRTPEIVLNPEDRLIVRATPYCPRQVIDPWEPEHVSIVNDPSCKCTVAAYDDLLSIYPELSKEPFVYGRSFDVGPNLAYLAEHPAVLGDSLSQGFYGGAVKPDTQEWAYPQVVARRMGAGNMEQNLIRVGPGAEDGVKTYLFAEFGLPPDAVTPLPQGENAGLMVGSGTTTTRPHNTGITGFDYTNVLRTTGRCLDVEATGDSPMALREPPDGDGSLRYDNRIEAMCGSPGVQCCPVDPNCHSERPWLEAQLGLGCSDETPMEMIEAQQPTFIFASVAQNHFLGCAVHTKVDECVEMDRFYRDSSEVFRRLRRIGSIRGGVVFGVPPIERIPFLVEHSPGARRAFWKRPGEIDDVEEVLDRFELPRLVALVDEANRHLAHLAALNGYVFVSSTDAFDALANVGLPLIDPATGNEMCRVRPVFATKTLDRDPFPGDDAGCGMFGLDGVHPNQLGHAVMANMMIGAIDAFYGVDIPPLSNAELFDIWLADSLNQDPVDMRAFLTGDPPTACIAAALEVSATLSTAPLCVLTMGGLCPATLATAIAAAGDGLECYEAVIREVVRDSFNKVDRAAEPQWCWGGQDGGACRFAP
jgi:hypothetical protein